MPQGLRKQKHVRAVPAASPRPKHLRVVAGTAVPAAELSAAEQMLTRPPRFYTHAWFDLACFLVLATMLTLAVVL